MRKLSLSANIKEAGTLSGEGEYSDGSPVEVSASPNESFVFESWQEEGGELLSTESNFTISLDKDTSLIANFIKEEVVLISKDSVKSKEEKKQKKEEEMRIAEEQRRAEERRLAEERRRAEEESREGVDSKIDKLEGEKGEIEKEKKEIEKRGRALEKELSDIQLSLNEILKKEEEIEAKERELSEKSGADQKLKRMLWGWQNKRRAIEKERWEWDEKVLKVTEELNFVKQELHKRGEVEKGVEARLADAKERLEKILLKEESSTLAKELSSLLINKKQLEIKIEELAKERRDKERVIDLVKDKIEELLSLKREIEEREATEEDAQRKRGIEKERWSTEDEIKRLEEESWEEEEGLTLFEERERLVNDEFEKLQTKIVETQKRIDEIGAILEGKPTVVKEEAPIEEESNQEIVEGYIRKISSDPEADIERAKKDTSFFNYVLERANQSKFI